MLQLVFSEDHPLNSTITDASTGQLVYKMKTPSRFIHRTTTINDAQGQFVAQYEQFWSNRKVTIRGCLFDFDTQFAPKTKKRSSQSTYVLPVTSPASPRTLTVINMYSRRIIAGLDGQQYEWKCHDRSTWKVCFASANVMPILIEPFVLLVD